MKLLSNRKPVPAAVIAAAAKPLPQAGPPHQLVPAPQTTALARRELRNQHLLLAKQSESQTLLNQLFWLAPPISITRGGLHVSINLRSSFATSLAY